MNLKISRSDLARGLKLAGGIVPRKPTIPILGDVLLRAGDGKLLVAATDLNVSLMAELPAAVSSPGSIALNASDLRQFVLGASGDDVSIITSEGWWAEIKIGRAKYKIAGHNDRDFPAIPTPISPVTADVDGALLHETLMKASYAVCLDDTRQAMCGVLVDGNTMASTDGHRLVRVTSKLMMPGRSVLSARGAQEFAKLTESGGECRIQVAGLRMFATVAGITISSSLLDFEFPKIEQVIPTTHKASAVVDREIMISALKRVAPLSDQLRGVVFKSIDGGLSLSARGKEGEQMTDAFDCEISGEIDICCAPKYAMDCLQHMTSSEVKMQTIGEFDPILFVEDGYTGVVMPMRRP